MTLILDGSSLTVAQLNRAARLEEPIDVDADALQRASRAHDLLVAAAAAGEVYGATTGVGANRSMTLDQSLPGQAFRLWRSSSVGTGATLTAPVARAAMIVRLNQILAGGSGIGPAMTEALAEAIREERTPVLHDVASIGTGDLSALSELGLTLSGERAWSDGSLTVAIPAEHDGLPLISSSAVTFAVAAAALERAWVFLHAATVVGALSFLAVRGSVEPFLPPHPAGFRSLAALFQDLTNGDAQQPSLPRRVQDPFGLRALPQVHGAAMEAWTQAQTVLEDGINGSHENPRVAGDIVIHNGRFHTMRTGLALDSFRSVLLSVSTLSSARTSKLMDPATSGLTAFLSDGGAGSSGLMLLEYVVEDALAELRLLAHPTSGASVSISLGVEEHASFAPQSARALTRMLEHLESILSAEALAAHRALSMDAGSTLSPSADRVVTALRGAVSTRLEDRPLGADLDAVRAVIRQVHDLARGPEAP
jgi:histidine ammonia-lyase